MRDLAQLGDRGGQLGDALVEECVDVDGAVAKVSLRQPHRHSQRDEPLLGAVVQVALEPQPFSVAHLDEPGPAGLDLSKGLGQLGSQPGDLHEAGGGRRDHSEYGGSSGGRRAQGADLDAAEGHWYQPVVDHRHPVGVDEPGCAGHQQADSQIWVAQRRTEHGLQLLRLRALGVHAPLQVLDRRQSCPARREQSTVDQALQARAQGRQQERADRGRSGCGRCRSATHHEAEAQREEGIRSEQDHHDDRIAHGVGDDAVDVVQVVAQHRDRDRRRQEDQRGNAFDRRHGPGRSRDHDLGEADEREDDPRQTCQSEPLELGARLPRRPAVPDDQRDAARKEQGKHRSKRDVPGDLDGQRRRAPCVGHFLQRRQVRLRVHRPVGLLRRAEPHQGGRHEAPSRTGQPAVREVEQEESNRNEQPPGALVQDGDDPVVERQRTWVADGAGVVDVERREEDDHAAGPGQEYADGVVGHPPGNESTQHGGEDTDCAQTRKRDRRTSTRVVVDQQPDAAPHHRHDEGEDPDRDQPRPPHL